MYFEKIYEYLKIIFELILPQNLNCIFCDMPISRNNRYSMCKSCYEKIIFINEACPKCGKPIENIHLDKKIYVDNCGYCEDRNFLFDRNISFLEYNETSIKFVFGLKYGMKTYLSKIMAEIMFDIIKLYYEKEISKIDFICFVPLSKKRYKERGFNQSEKIAFYLSKYLQIPIINAIERKKNTKRLFKLSKNERKKELRNAFNISKKYENNLEGARIILIDDIFTTGSTVDEISKVLKMNGVEQIIVMSFLTGKYTKDLT